ncbi:probable leucine-rich repeat receptor-like protein kinase At5g49770 [Prunus avium]|uniref:non-specific serine/threonine protein kinase n=1 Tax=Prunus avium TaxID=42229 RepID=A0A6P5TPJ8_PRUAV|nr:probable leucine-rich repeat receptor-like protein kinase At5g49770 [Prunus avium]
MATMRLLLFLAFCSAGIHVIFSETDPNDAVIFISLKEAWKNLPPSWNDKSNDPCRMKWEGVTCNNSRVTELRLSAMNLEGQIEGDIGILSELRSLDLSFNKGLRGSLSSQLGDLSKLNFLILAGCSFSGNIPDELGNLGELTFLALNTNNFTGKIPPSLGKLSKLFWLDLAGNQLTGTLPISTNVTSGLDKLLKAEHFHFNKNQLSGTIPPEHFSSEMKLIHILFDENQFIGEIPSTIAHVQTLEVLVLEFGALEGTVPEKMFSITSLQQVKLKNNAFNETLNLGDSISPQLQLVDLRNNQIPKITPGYEYKHTLILVGNPVCADGTSSKSFCQPPQQDTETYTTGSKCAHITCPDNQKHSPQSCLCAYPFEVTLYFRATPFRDLSNVTRFNLLEMSLRDQLGLTPGSVSLEKRFFDSNDHLQIQLALFPPTGIYFNRSEIIRIGFDLSIFEPPEGFRPYYFIPAPYTFPGGNKSSMNTGVIIGISVSCVVLVLGLVVVGIYAIRQKKRAERAIGLSRPFASWAPSGKDSGGAPQLKGARWFSYDELKKCTNNFSDSNEIGSGGYGKVYRGMFSDGQVVAIKRAQQGSMQGGLEFKTEIELLSRVHHKNVVGLLGFCFEQGEQMLVYEFMPNGTLRESLSGRSGIHLDWKRRLRITLGSARGLAYLHELANPPIIHRDVKSTNILLDEHLTAKVADFGLSKLVADSGKGYVSSQVKGTLGYLDPEYYTTQQLTEKSDVYSFGVVMLELITARQPIEKGKYIVREVRLMMDKNDEEHYGLRELMDRSIRNPGTLIGFGRFLELALQCVEESAADRPTMSELVKAIETILQNDGMNTNSTLASSSATEFAASKGAPKHPYNDGLLKREVNDSTGAFDYSGGYAVSPKIEPK